MSGRNRFIRDYNTKLLHVVARRVDPEAQHYRTICGVEYADSAPPKLMSSVSTAGNSQFTVITLFTWMDQRQFRCMTREPLWRMVLQPGLTGCRDCLRPKRARVASCTCQRVSRCIAGGCKTCCYCDAPIT